ncbi:transferrin receptor protein 1-like [Pundamilia nyererei]|uniref:Transferrin receptor protein 1 n=1 Tax=Pundamilia nyererei TaxID=303518 RepID=A0A9Y6M7C0_9CICH|nr:PREDICTED: transferrin receptor protein 1-like [Pundamilia nyererei]
MDQARSTISKIFNGEPHSYTRFNLTQNMEGDNSQVEMKLSSEIDEETGGNGVGGHLNHNSNRTPYVAQKFGRTPKNLCFMAATIFLIFIIGYLIGYLVHRNKDLAPTCAPSALRYEDVSVAHETGAAPLMDWDDVKKLLAEKLTTSSMDAVLGQLTSSNHRAGSPGDEDLGNKVITKFKEYSMKTWTDEHFVKVQDPPASGYNRIVFKNESEEHPTGFLSYSASGTARGAVLYAHYGQEDDLRQLKDMNIDMNNRVMLVRAGRISFAEKVANAAKVNASAVLIYPDPADYSIGESTPLFGHVHMGSGDPYTPGFPSFNHTQFPPVQSSGLPNISAQTITTGMGMNILRQLGGRTQPNGWEGINRLGDESDVITVEVNNVLTEKRINNVFGVIKGFVDADRYVVIGAQRDAWGPGFAASSVGTSVLVELARSISDMVENGGFKPRRSIVFASWSAGEYGSVGATEWLEVRSAWQRFRLAAFFFYSTKINLLIDYPHFNTNLDTRENLNSVTASQVPQLAVRAGQFAGHIALRLVHDHLLQMDLKKYNQLIRSHVVQINGKVKTVQRMQPQLLPKALTVRWLIMASGSYSRASSALAADIQNSDLEDIEMCRVINDRIMTVERNFLSPYVSPRDSPFRHILLGSGPHTLKALTNHLDSLTTANPDANAEQFRNQFAQATWTIQTCANSLAGDIWSLDNEI